MRKLKNKVYTIHSTLDKIDQLYSEIKSTEKYKIFIDNLIAQREETIIFLAKKNFNQLPTNHREIGLIAVKFQTEKSLFLGSILQLSLGDMAHNVPAIIKGKYYNCGKTDQIKIYLITQFLVPLYCFKEIVQFDSEFKMFHRASVGFVFDTK